MSAPPAYKEALVCPTAPTSGQGYDGFVDAGVAGPTYPTYPAPVSSQYPPYPVSQPPYPSGGGGGYDQPPYPQPMPPYPLVSSASGGGYDQPPYQAGGSPYNPNASAAYGAGTGVINQRDPEQGAVDDGTEVWTGASSFSDKKIRQQFIKKVYLILMSQLFFTFGVVCLFYFSHPVKYWVQSNQWFYWCSYAVFLITYITLVCCDGVRRRWPSNIICLFIFTAAFSYLTGTITSFYDTQSVFIAIGITAAVCLSISLFAIQTKIDFTLCSGLIFALSMVLIFFGFACMITYLVSGPNYILHCVYGGLAAIVFSLFLIFDTQMVVGGSNRRYQLSPEEYIYGALQLYVDVVQLFIIILGLVGGKRN